MTNSRPPADDPWVAVAVVLRPHGLAGVMRLKPLTRELDELLDCPVRSFHVRRNGRIEQGTLTLEDVRPANDVLHARFKEITGRDVAQRYVNCELVIPEEELWDPPEGTCYMHDLPGLEVRDAESGAKLGVVRESREGPVHDYLVLRLDSHPKQDVLLPMVEQFVAEIVLDEEYVSVRIPPGLVD